MNDHLFGRDLIPAMRTAQLPAATGAADCRTHKRPPAWVGVCASLLGMRFGWGTGI